MFDSAAGSVHSGNTPVSGTQGYLAVQQSSAQEGIANPAHATTATGFSQAQGAAHSALPTPQRGHSRVAVSRLSHTESPATWRRQAAQPPTGAPAVPAVPPGQRRLPAGPRLLAPALVVHRHWGSQPPPAPRRGLARLRMRGALRRQCLEATCGCGAPPDALAPPLRRNIAPVCSKPAPRAVLCRYAGRGKRNDRIWQGKCDRSPVAIQVRRYGRRGHGTGDVLAWQRAADGDTAEALQEPRLFPANLGG